VNAGNRVASSSDVANAPSPAFVPQAPSPAEGGGFKSCRNVQCPRQLGGDALQMFNPPPLAGEGGATGEGPGHSNRSNFDPLKTPSPGLLRRPPSPPRGRGNTVVAGVRQPIWTPQGLTAVVCVPRTWCKTPALSPKGVCLTTSHQCHSEEPKARRNLAVPLLSERDSSLRSE